MTAGIFIGAIRLTGLDVVGGLLGAIAVVLIFWLAAALAQEEERERPERVEPVDFAEEIRVHDLTRRGPDRVPSGRRAA